MSRVARGVRSFAAFWWDFIVGEDWRVAAGIVAGLAITAALAHNGTNAWWVLAVTVPLILALSLRAAIRRRT